MTPIDELDGPELDERLARAMGRVRYEADVCVEYHASIDALLRDVWPVCQERGSHFWDVYNLLPAVATVYDVEGNELSASAPTPQLALARAMLAVLEARE